MALERIKEIPKEQLMLIHHSDRGVQYASKRYVELLTQHGIHISMTEDGNPKENPQAERINNTMKNELLKDKRFTSLDEVIAAIIVAVRFYNEERMHMSIDMMTPREAANCTGELKKHWRSLRQEHIKARRAEAQTTETAIPVQMQQSTVIPITQNV